ncbi:MAG: hypothetical protein AAFZ18_06640 [Myxococcota bacterium]
MKAALLLPVLVFGCGELDPDVGERLAERCLDEDSDPAADVSFERDLLPLFEATPGCRCHLSTSPEPVGVSLTGLDMATRESLLRGGSISRSDIVVPGSPCRSILYLKTGGNPPFGSRMPFDGPPLLSSSQRQMIADWIAEGAPP